VSASSLRPDPRGEPVRPPSHEHRLRRSAAHRKAARQHEAAARHHDALAAWYALAAAGTVRNAEALSAKALGERERAVVQQDLARAAHRKADEELGDG
jgi:hypothetical protein